MRIIPTTLIFLLAVIVGACSGGSDSDGPSASMGCSGAQCSDENNLDTPPLLDQPLPADAILVSNKAELEEAISIVSGGETIALATGDYGQITINAKVNSSFVLIRPQVGATPKLTSLQVKSSQNWHIAGLSILPRIMNGDSVAEAVSLNGEDIIFEDCNVNFIENSSGWSASDWIAYAKNGVRASGTKLIVRNNIIKNTAFALNSGASYSSFSGNIIDGFRGDGMRGLGDYATFENNDVRNCVKVDDNHDDGFQSWSRGTDGKVGTGEVKGVVLRGNYFLDNEDPNHPLKCTLQGIGLFDGTFVDWIVENNVVIVDHWHGISFYGSRNVKIVNNTVMDSNPGVRPGPPWIMITDHKDGTPSTNGLIRNNIAATFTGGPGVTMDSNIKASSPHEIFVNPDLYDFRLKAGSPAIDAGNPSMAPALDIEGVPRPLGSGIDIGAYESF